MRRNGTPVCRKIMRIMKKYALILGLVALASGCAHQANVVSTSAGYEVRSDKVNNGKAYVYISQDLDSLERIVKPGHICGAHTYPLDAGPAVRASIMKTMEAAYKQVISVPSRSAAQSDAPMFAFSLDEFNPRLRFVPGFWSATADSSVEMAIKTSTTGIDGKEVSSATVRGFGQDSVDGGCETGADILAKSTQKAIRVTLENFVARVINTGVVK